MRKTERRGGIAATARAAPSGSAWDVRPGRSDVAPTLRSSGSRSASICSWARPTETAWSRVTGSVRLEPVRGPLAALERRSDLVAPILLLGEVDGSPPVSRRGLDVAPG